MGGFVEGADRHQASFLPTCLEDYAEADRGLMQDPAARPVPDTPNGGGGHGHRNPRSP